MNRLYPNTSMHKANKNKKKKKRKLYQALWKLGRINPKDRIRYQSTEALIVQDIPIKFCSPDIPIQDHTNNQTNKLIITKRTPPIVPTCKLNQ